ncbi:MAG: hypothetical protein WAT39_06655 [Planctomycetota bacterium]
MRAVLLSMLAAALAPPVLAQNATDLLVADYQKRRDEELIATGQRHVDLGWSIRDSGLIQQATWQFVRAVELSEGKHQGASMVLGIVRNYGEAFWKKRKKTPSKASLVAYEKKAAMLDREDLTGQVKLAKMAGKAKLNGRMTEHWLAALKLGAKVEVSDDGGKIEGEVVPREFAKWLEQQTSKVNGKARYEPAGEKAPRLENVREVADAKVAVRTDLPGAVAEDLHALALAEWPLLQDRLDGAPTRPLQLFVFSKRADYANYLRACGHGAALAGSGLCDYGTFQTLVCAEGLEPADLHALVLHELAHLFFFGASPVAMPDWYCEGFAESFGGQGTFTWDGKKLVIGAAMRADRKDAMKKAPMPLRDLLAGSAVQLLAGDKDLGLRFYAQCEALQRWFLLPDNPYRERFVAWEAECRGAMPGVQTTARFGDAGPAAAAFQREFAKDLDALEKAFLAWLATY